MARVQGQGTRPLTGTRGGGIFSPPPHTCIYRLIHVPANNQVQSGLVASLWELPPKLWRQILYVESHIILLYNARRHLNELYIIYYII